MTTSVTTSVQWLGKIGSEGGPLLIADLASFAKWPGDEDEDFDRGGLDKKAAVKSFGKQKAAFWDPMSPGSISIGVANDGTEIVLLFGIVDDDADLEAQKTRLAAIQEELACGNLAMSVDVAVVAWMPPSADDIGEETFDASVEAGVRKALKTKKFVVLDADISNIGLAFRIQPGTFAVSTGSKKTDNAKFRWCRLKRS